MFVQPGSSGRDVDTRRQEAVGVTDDVKWNASCATRASPALAHGADEGYSVMKEQLDVAVSAGNDIDSLAASTSKNMSAAPTVTAADDRPPAKNSYHSVRSLKHKNDRSCKYGTGSADLQRASSLQDLTDTAVERSHHLSTENVVSCGQASDIHRLHDASSSDAWSTNPAGVRRNRLSTTHAGEQVLVSPRRLRCRTRQSATKQELVSFGNTGLVSNAMQFWENLVVDSSGSVTRHGVRLRHMSEDRHRFMRRDVSSRYSTIGAPCDLQALHGTNCVQVASSDDVLPRTESLHANSSLEVCLKPFICH